MAAPCRLADLDLGNGRYSKGLVKDGWGQQLSALWAEVKSREFPALPSRLELFMTYQIEATYNRLIQEADKKLARWKATADRGWVVGGFGEAAGALLSSSLEEFDRETQPLALSPLRLAKHEELEAALTTGIQALVKQQLSNLQAQGLKKFKASLVKLVGKDNREDEEILAQEALEAWFEEAATALVVPGAAPTYTQALTDFVAQLTEYAQKWPTSPAYNVQAMKRLEKKSKKRPGKPAYGMSFQLVGHVRVPGRGNLQGFTTYQAGPLQLLFGFQNDRSLLSSRFEGKPPPLLRLQPKVALDIDL